MGSEGWSFVFAGALSLSAEGIFLFEVALSLFAGAIILIAGALSHSVERIFLLEVDVSLSAGAIVLIAGVLSLFVVGIFLLAVGLILPEGGLFLFYGVRLFYFSKFQAFYLGKFGTGGSEDWFDVFFDIVCRLK